MTDMGDYSQAITRADVAATMPVYVSQTGDVCHSHRDCPFLYPDNTQGRPRRPPTAATATRDESGNVSATVRGRRLPLCSFCQGTMAGEHSQFFQVANY
jgi:hypothetical protein